MFIELIDVLRCTRPHEDTWLVAAFHRLIDREVFDGLLSCPVCGARYPIVDGVAYFDVPAGTQPVSTESASDDDGALAIRAAAFLNFTEGATLVLCGAWAGGAAKLAGLGARVIAVNAKGAGDGVSHVRSAGGVLPLAASSVHGIALDGNTPHAAESAARALKAKGRLVAPAAMQVPQGITEITRDADWWIGERVGERVSAPVKIGRR